MTYNIVDTKTCWENMQQQNFRFFEDILIHVFCLINLLLKLLLVVFLNGEKQSVDNKNLYELYCHKHAVCEHTCSINKSANVGFYKYRTYITATEVQEAIYTKFKVSLTDDQPQWNIR